jgi:phosphate uptake regulator
MSEMAAEPLTRRYAAGCEWVARLDREVDELDRGIFEEILTYARYDGPREWATRMNRMSRHLERAADHAVDFAQAAWFVITGDLREFD